MNDMLADVLRCGVSCVMSTLLLFTMAQPKYGKKIMCLAVLSILLIDIGSSVYFYLQNDYTSLAKFDVLMFIMLCFFYKPLFRDSIMQWLFNFITMMNVYVAVMVLSYVICHNLPYPAYANILMRFLLFAAVIFVFHRYIRPLYRQVVEHWNVFFLVVLGILISFCYYIFASHDITETLSEQFVPLSLLILLAVFIYISIFYSLKTLSSEYALREENIKTEMRHELLQSELTAYEDFVNVSNQHRHDLRHHNAILWEYLTEGDINGARAYLQQYDESIEQTALHRYCQNPTANALLRLYERRTEKSGIAFAVSADIPNNLTISAPGLGTVLSNILENAYEACEKSSASDHHIVFSAETNEKNMKIELRNSVRIAVQFKDGMPVSSKDGGGTGTKSTQRIVEKHGGMLRFKQEKDEFFTQIVLPLQ